MTVIRFTLNDGTIFYTRDIAAALIQSAFLRPLFAEVSKMMKLVQHADQTTVMEMTEHEYFALPMMPEELSNRGLVSRWEVRVE